jgi:hypothetical protein
MTFDGDKGTCFHNGELVDMSLQVSCTENEYGLPIVRPVTVHVDGLRANNPVHPGATVFKGIPDANNTFQDWNTQSLAVPGVQVNTRVLTAGVPVFVGVLTIGAVACLRVDTATVAVEAALFVDESVHTCII